MSESTNQSSTEDDPTIGTPPPGWDPDGGPAAQPPAGQRRVGGRRAVVTRPMSDRRARAIIDAATLVKAPDWSESRRWHVVSGGELLVVVAPSHGGTSASGRNGWRWWIAALGPSGDRRHETSRRQAAARGLADWQRWTTNKETP